MKGLKILTLMLAFLLGTMEANATGIYIRVQPQDYIYSGSTLISGNLLYTPANDIYRQYASNRNGVFIIGSPQDPSNYLFPSEQAALTYYNSMLPDSLIDQINFGTGGSDTMAGTFFDTGHDQANFSTTDSLALSYILNKPAASSYSNSVSHSIVTTAAAANGFTVSSTRNAIVSYSVLISTSSTITGGADGKVVLEQCTASCGTAGNWTAVGTNSQGQALGLAIALSITQPITQTITAYVPANISTRLRSINTAGTPTFTYIGGWELLL